MLFRTHFHSIILSTTMALSTNNDHQTLLLDLGLAWAVGLHRTCSRNESNRLAINRADRVLSGTARSVTVR